MNENVKVNHIYMLHHGEVLLNIKNIYYNVINSRNKDKNKNLQVLSSATFEMLINSQSGFLHKPSNSDQTIMTKSCFTVESFFLITLSC